MAILYRLMSVGKPGRSLLGMPQLKKQWTFVLLDPSLELSFLAAYAVLHADALCLRSVHKPIEVSTSCLTTDSASN